MSKSMIADALDGKARGAYHEMMDRHQRFPTTADLATFELFHCNETRPIYQELYQKATEEAENLAKQEAEKKKLAYEPLEPESDEVLTQFFLQLYSSDNPVLKKKLREYHKYFCIVHADGDGIGNTINSIADVDMQTEFSDELANFKIEAAQAINSFGGKPVYIGGDDMLFFSPVCTQQGSIFKLIKDLSNAFLSRTGEFLMKKGLDNVEAPTLSFGLTITYHKFPLFEAREMSQAQLNERAKLYVNKTQSKKKDAVAFRLTKHTGSYFEALLTKDQLSKFLEAETELRANSTDLLSSIVYKLDLLEKLMETLIDGQTSQIPVNRLDNLFRNFFNERIHRQHEGQMQLLKDLVLSIYNQPGTIDGKKVNLNKSLYAVLRLLKFITDKQS